MQTRLDIPIVTTWGICRRNDPVCPQNKRKNRKVIFTDKNGKETVCGVCENCAEAIVKRSERMGGGWRHA